MRIHSLISPRRHVVAPLATLLLLAACGTDPVDPDGGNQQPPPFTPRVTSIVVTPASATMVVGETRQLTAEVRGQNGAPMTGQAPTWSSGSTSIATVSGNGSTASVTAVSAGNAVILATLNGITGSAALSVAAPVQVTPVAFVRCAPATVTLPVGQTVALQGTAHDAGGNVLAGRPLAWLTSNPGVVAVSGNGVITAVAPGVASVTVSAEGRSATCVIAVPAPVSQVTLVVTNQLIATVAISVQGTVVGTVPPQSTRQATVTSAPSLDVSFEVIEPRLGNRVLGDRMSGRWTLTAPAGTVNLTVDNLVGSTWYFAPLVTNLTGTSLLMAVNFGLQAENRCGCVVPVGGRRVFLGYYRLFSNSMLHAYRDGSNYTGAYRYFFDFGNQVPRGSGAWEFTYSVFP